LDKEALLSCIDKIISCESQSAGININDIIFTVMAAIPIILMYSPLQKYVISGLPAGSVKE